MRDDETRPNDGAIESVLAELSEMLGERLEDVIGNDLHENCAGVLPSDVKEANRNEKMREIDRQLLGLFVTRAAISEVPPGEFYGFMESHVDALRRYSEENPKPLEERLQKAGDRYRWT